MAAGTKNMPILAMPTRSLGRRVVVQGMVDKNLNKREYTYNTTGPDDSESCCVHSHETDMSIMFRANPKNSWTDLPIYLGMGHRVKSVMPMLMVIKIRIIIFDGKQSK